MNVLNFFFPFSFRFLVSIEKEQIDVKKKLEESGKVIETLNLDKKFASDYYTPQEMEKFKKKPSKKKNLKERTKLEDQQQQQQQSENSEMSIAEKLK